MNASQRWVILTAVVAALSALATSALAAPARLELAGEPAPVNLVTIEREGERYVPASALTVLGWAVRWQNAECTAAEVSDGRDTFRLEAGRAEAVPVAAGGEAPAARPLKQPPVEHERMLYLPVSALQEVLSVPVEWDEKGKVLRLGTPPTPDPERLREWCGILGLPDPAVFHRSGFRVQLGAPQGTELPVEQEFLLTARPSSEACVQIFERYEQHPPKPLLGWDEGGRWAKLHGWRVARWGFTPTAQGKWTYLALATTEGNPPTNLLEWLRGEGAGKGEWAIDVVEVTVTERGTPSIPPE